MRKEWKIRVELKAFQMEAEVDVSGVAGATSTHRPEPPKIPNTEPQTHSLNFKARSHQQQIHKLPWNPNTWTRNPKTS